MFHRFGIEALTVECVKRESSSPNQNNQQKIMALLRIVEGISRSLNNLLERFHQSFFFYVIISADRFVSIGDYMPSVGLMAGSLLIKSFLLWLMTSKSDDQKTDTNKEEDDKKILIVRKTSRHFDVLNVGTVALIAHLIGISALFIITNKSVHDYMHSLNVQTQTGISYLVLLISIISLMVPKFFPISSVDGQFLNIVVLLELGTMLLTVSMLNFSLGFFLCIVIVPSAIVMNVRENESCNLFTFLAKSLCHILIHPVFIVYCVVLALSFASFPELNFNNLVDKSFTATVDGITYSIVDSLVGDISIINRSMISFYYSRFTATGCLILRA